jgi:hypothetical protein
MKKLLIGLLALSSISAFAATNEISRVSERNSNRELVYSQNETTLIFSLKQNGIEREIKRLDFDINNNELTINGDSNRYQFNFLKKMTRASGKAYKWCWTDSSVHQEGGGSLLVPATSGAFIAIVGAIPTMALCAVGPGVPFILGVLAAPIDGMITAGDALLDSEVIAARKFSKLLRAKGSKASPKVFNDLVKKISDL